jgi:hypothetical protein
MGVNWKHVAVVAAAYIAANLANRYLHVSTLLAA